MGPKPMQRLSGRTPVRGFQWFGFCRSFGHYKPRLGSGWLFALGVWHEAERLVAPIDTYRVV